MELIAAFIAAVLGWRSGALGSREVKAIALVVLGWTSVTTLASIPHVSLVGTAYVAAFRALLISVPYAIGVSAKRLQRRSR